MAMMMQERLVSTSVTQRQSPKLWMVHGSPSVTEHTLLQFIYETRKVEMLTDYVNRIQNPQIHLENLKCLRLTFGMVSFTYL